MMTGQERRVVIFLLVVALLGAGIDFIKKNHSRIRGIPKIEYDFGSVDLNRADKQALMAVSGIGEKISQRILEYRRAHGAFGSIEELKNIKGITAYRFEKIRNSVCVK